MTAVSGQEPAPKEAAPQPPAVPEGAVVLDKKEHDRIQAELRRAQKALADKEEAERKRAEEERAQAAKAAGDFDSALAAERAEKEELRKRLVDRDKRDAVRDEIAKRGLTGSKAALVTKLADLATVTESDAGFDATAAVQAVVDEYPDLLGASEPEPEPAERIRRNGPAPKTDGAEKPFEGYVSPDEYQRTPAQIRMSPEFQQRVRNSRSHWAKSFPADSLPKGNE